MTYELITSILDELGLPYAYYQFKKPPEGNKYIAYFESDKIRLMADNVVYYFEPHFAIELYTKDKDIATENRLIELLKVNEVPWSGGESNYIDSEKVYQTVFYV